MAYFSDRLISANKLILAAAVVYASAVTFAHADADDRQHAALACLNAHKPGIQRPAGEPRARLRWDGRAGDENSRGRLKRRP